MYYTTEINEQIIMDVVDEIVSGGYRDRGYEYVCVDDGWSTSRDPVTNELRADPIKFPSGIAALVNYTHARGLKFGIYADVGSLTCGGYSGLDMDKDLKNKQYIADVATFASWDIDALKVDGCYQDPAIMNITYPALSDAINASGHAMWLSCSWPCYVGGCSGGPSHVDPNVYSVLQEKCNSWRDANDMYDNEDSLYNIIGAYTNPVAIKLHNGVIQAGAWNDPDMLVAGGGGCSPALETMQLVMWAMMSAPLIMSNDLPNISPESKTLLLNGDLLAVNQDVTYASSFNVTDDHTYCKNLQGGAIALAGIHQSSLGPPTNITLSPGPTPSSSRLSNCLLPEHANVTSWAFRDVLRGLDLNPGASIDCLAAQPGSCLVVATPR